MTESFLSESLGEGICESRVTLIFAFRGRLAQNDFAFNHSAMSAECWGVERDDRIIFRQNHWGKGYAGRVKRGNETCRDGLLRMILLSIVLSYRQNNGASGRNDRIIFGQNHWREDMPVECSVEIRPIGQERFHAIDTVVMKHAFNIHNTLGRFCDERVYQNELVDRCKGDGLEVHREVLLRAVHQGFAKPYFIDMLVERGIIYELKTTETLSTSHQAQLINYLLLMDLNHGKLVNFRPSSVQSRFVSTRLRRSDRTSFQLVDCGWQGDDNPSLRLREILSALFSDWGTFLDVNLYREALLHFIDGPESRATSVDIEVNGRIVGTQQMCILCEGTAWHISSVRQARDAYGKHLGRLFRHTRLNRMHWINLDQRTVTFQTLKK